LYQNGPLTLGELRNQTGISTNILNHNLTEMKSVGLIQKIGKKYYLTKYGAVLFEELDKLKGKVYEVPQNNLFKPHAEQEA